MRLYMRQQKEKPFAIGRKFLALHSEGKNMQTYTRSNTSTYARHIASKVAADLKRLQRIYGIGSPSNLDIDNNQEEIALLLDMVI